MLTLGRRTGEYIVLGDNIVVQVIEVGKQMRLAIDAPQEVAIVRGEHYERNHETPDCIRRVRQKPEIRVFHAGAKV